MSAEIHEEAMMASPHYNSSSSVSNDQCSSGVVAKGKRTKRQRQLLQSSSTPAATSSSTTSSSSGDHSGSATEEEEDMAKCLILLARGHALDVHPKSRPAAGEEAVVRETAGERFTSRRLAETATTTNGKVSFYVYECKTCSKCFPSFQALGGHRASHKKPKTTPVTAMMAVDPEKYKSAREDVLPIRSIAPHSNPDGKAAAPAPMVNGSSSVNTAVGNNRSRVHECSICGSEFSSGQALGGHMRRHRTAAAAAAVPEPLQEAKKEKNILCLDLNLPAPMEDERGDAPSFPTAKQTLIFSGSALVDCHY